MCDPVSISAGIGVLGTLNTARNNRRATRDANRRQASEIRQNTIENQRQADAQHRRAELSFLGQQEASQRASTLEKKQREGERKALEPLERIEGFEQELNQNINNQKQIFADDLNDSIESGQQGIDDDVTGKVSEAFTEASNAAEQDNIARANTSADRRARISGASDLFRDDVKALTKSGQEVGIDNLAIQRQREIEAFLRQLAENRADVESRIAPSPVILQ